MAKQPHLYSQSVTHAHDDEALNNSASGGSYGSVKASLDLDTVSADLDTIVEAATAGTAGNGITVAVVGDSPAAGGVTIDVVDNAVTIHFEDGVSTVGDVETAIAALAGADDIIDVKTAGTGATVLDAATDEVVATALAGGLDNYTAAVETKNGGVVSIMGHVSGATTLTVQVSPDGTTFYDTATTAVLGGASDFHITLTTAAKYVRLKTSATITISATVQTRAA